MQSRLIVPLLLVFATSRLDAQFPPGDMPGAMDMESMRAFAEQMMNPAAQLLAQREELGLTPAQVTVMDSLSKSLGVAIGRQFEAAADSPLELMSALTDPAAPIDEAGIRAMYRQQADAQADMMIEMMRAERRIAQLLTPAQMEKRRSLQEDSAMQMLREMMGGMNAP